MNFLELIWLIPLLPLVGAALMLFFGKKLDPQPVSDVAVAPGVEPVYEHGHSHDHGQGHDHHHDRFSRAVLEPQRLIPRRPSCAQGTSARFGEERGRSGLPLSPRERKIA